MATIARAQNAQMTFALLNSGVGAAGVLLSLVIPRIISIYGMDGAYFIHLVFSLLAFLFILLISFEKDTAEEKITLKPYKGKLGWIAMFEWPLHFRSEVY